MGWNINVVRAPVGIGHCANNFPVITAWDGTVRDNAIFWTQEIEQETRYVVLDPIGNERVIHPPADLFGKPVSGHSAKPAAQETRQWRRRPSKDGATQRPEIFSQFRTRLFRHTDNRIPDPLIDHVGKGIFIPRCQGGIAINQERSDIANVADEINTLEYLVHNRHVLAKTGGEFVESGKLVF